MDDVAATPEAQATPKPFSLADYELADTAVIALKNKKGTDDLLGADGEPVTVEIYSPGSEQGVKALRKQARNVQMRTMRTLRGEIDKGDAALAEQEQAEKLAAITKGFSANFPAAAIAVYSNPKLSWISQQVQEEFGKTSNF